MIFTRTHTNHNVGWFSPELTNNHNIGWFSPRDHVATTPVWVESPGVSIPWVWVGAWNLFTGQVPQRCLVSKFMSSIICFDLLPQVHAQQGASLFWLSQSSRNFNWVKRSTMFIMSSIKCFDLSPQVHKVQALSGSNFLWRRRRHTFSSLFLNENRELSRSHSRQIDLRRQGLHSRDLLPCWFRSKVTGVAY